MEASEVMPPTEIACANAAAIAGAPAEEKPSLEVHVRMFLRGSAFEDTDMDETTLDSLFKELQEHPFLAEEFVKVEDLQGYTDSVAEDLRKIELDSVQDYVSQTDRLLSLHSELKALDGKLEEMHQTLKCFLDDLSHAYQHIQSLQNQSGDIGIAANNRRELRRLVGSLVVSVTVPPYLVRAVLEEEITERFHRHLISLEKVQAARSSWFRRGAACCADASEQLRDLMLVASYRIRDFLQAKMALLTRPGTNVQLLQQSVLIRYCPLHHFLLRNSPEIALSLREKYLEIMRAILYSHFSTYITSFVQLKLKIGGPQNFVGAPQGTATRGSSEAGALSLNTAGVVEANRESNPASSRLSILKQLDQPVPVVPHSAQQQALRFPVEFVFRSAWQLLVDAASAEHYFQLQWFGTGGSNTQEGLLDNLFREVFFRPLELYSDTLTRLLSNSYDPLGLLLIMCITQHISQALPSGKLFPSYLSDHFRWVSRTTWTRIRQILEANLASLRNAKSQFTGSITVDLQPHHITRRYAEICCSLHTLNSFVKSNDLVELLALLRHEIEQALNRFAEELPRGVSQCAFLINNYDFLLGVLHERESSAGWSICDDSSRFSHLLDVSRASFVEDELSRYLAPLVAFMRDNEARVLSGTLQEIDDDALDDLNRAFSVSWTQSLREFDHDVKCLFPNIELGRRILQQLLNQFVIYYTRFEDFYKRRARPRSGSKSTFVPLATLTYEVRKYSQLRPNG